MIAKIINVNPLLGIATASIPLVGGHGTSATFSQNLAEAGLENAVTITLAAATFGLVAGSLLGGPVGRFLAEKGKKQEKVNLKNKNIDLSIMEDNSEITEKNFAKAFYLLLLVMSLGTIISDLLNLINLKFPASVGGMLASSVVINIAENLKKPVKLPQREIAMIGSVSLSIFLAFSMMKLKLWQLVDLMGPMLILLFVQVLLMIIFATVICYPIMGKDYESAVMTSGLCGFGLGAVPTAMANMKTLEEKYGPAPEAFFIVPLVGSLFINIINSFVIVFFINIVG